MPPTSTPRSAHGTQTRFHLHFTPTSASWLNQVECWFNIITRGSFNTVSQLVKTIQNYIDSYNQTAKPFVWVATADSTLGKLNRLTT